MRHGKLWGLLAAVLALLILASAAAPVYASVKDLKQEKGKVQQELQQERSNLKQYRSREAELGEELEQLDRRLRELQSELAEVNTEIAATEAEVAQTEEELAETRAELAGKEKLFKRRLRTIYEQGSLSYIDILLGAASFSDFLTRFYNLKIIAASDQELIEAVRAERDRIEEMKEKLEQKKTSLGTMRRQILNSEADVERTIASRQSVRGELQQEIERNEKAIREMESEAKYLEGLIRQLTVSPGSADVNQGAMCWPTSPRGRITSPFGPRIHPQTGRLQLHTGMDIGGFRAYWPLEEQYRGTPAYVLAAESGEVIFSGVSLSSGNSVNKAPGQDEVRNPQYYGYGSFLMIDHHNGYVTVYAHCHSRAVAKGQKVKRGQVIATIGSTGSSTGPHLHFEVRRNGSYVNPHPYVN